MRAGLAKRVTPVLVTSQYKDSRQHPPQMPTRVQLVHKFAEVLNGIDLSHAEVGDVIEVPPRDAEVLILEGWAVPLDAPEPLADDKTPRRLRRKPAQL